METTGNKHFSMARFVLVAKYDFMGNWRSNLLRFLLVAGILFVIVFMHIWFASKGSRAFDETWESLSWWIQVAFSVGAMYAACQVMEPMNSKVRRLSFLMLPATNAEKFVWRVLFVTVGFAVMFVLAFAVADLAHYLVLPLFGFPEGFGTSLTVEMFRFSGFYYGPNDSLSFKMGDLFAVDMSTTSGVVAFAWTLMSMLLGYSLDLLGGSLWRRHPFAKTFGSLLLFGLVLAMCVPFVLSLFPDDIYWDEKQAEAWLHAAAYAGPVVQLVLTVICVRLSYKLFKRSQIIEPKLFRK